MACDPGEAAPAGQALRLPPLRALHGAGAEAAAGTAVADMCRRRREVARSADGLVGRTRMRPVAAGGLRQEATSSKKVT